MAEVNDLQRFSEIVQMSKSGAWGDFREMLTGWMSLAYEKMMTSEYASDAMLAAYSRAYIQRRKLLTEIDNFTSSAVKGLEEITEAMRQDLERAAHEVEYQ